MPPEKQLITDFITLMKQKGSTNCDIARALGVSEGTVRYRLKRKGKPDLRKNRPSGLDPYHDVILNWINLVDDGSDKRRRPPFKVLYTELRCDHGYKGSYDSVCHYMRRHFPDFWKRKPFTRIETPPGVLMQVDWKESVPVCLGSARNRVKLNFLLIQMSFSRKGVLLVFDDRRLDSFLAGHMEAFQRFGGVTEVIRSDCLRSAVTRYKGRESLLNEGYKRFLNELGIKAFPARPAKGSDKGKVERKIRSIMERVYLSGRVFRDLSDLQARIDRAMEELEKEQRCGATGLSIADSWAYERKYLKPLKRIQYDYPIHERLATVNRDCTVRFRNNYYQVEQRFMGRIVYCVQTRLHIKIYLHNELIAQYPYLPKSKGMVMLSQKALRDPGLIVSDWTREKALEVACRQVEIYEHISNGGC